MNLTNDSWFGPTSAPRSHLVLSIFRTIETRRPLLRATNTGITAYVDITGHVHNPTKLFEPIIYEASIPVGKVRTTFFLRFGPWLILLCGTFCLGALAMIYLPARRKA